MYVRRQSVQLSTRYVKLREESSWSSHEDGLSLLDDYDDIYHQKQQRLCSSGRG